MRTTVSLLSLLSALLLAAAPASAQLRGSSDVVDVELRPAAVDAAPGARVEFVVELDIERKWHLYAHGDTTFIGVDLVPDEDFPLAEFKAFYPEGHEGEFFGEKVMMLEGENTIAARAVVPEDLPAGEHAVTLKLTVQACDDKTCLAPARVPVGFTLTVER